MHSSTDKSIRAGRPANHCRQSRRRERIPATPGAGNDGSTPLPRFGARGHSTAGTATLLATLLMVGIGLAFALSQIPTVLKGQATVRSGSGVEWAADEGGEWQTAPAGTHLQEDSRVRVLTGSAVIALFDGSVLELRPGAEIQLDRMRSGLFRGSYCICVRQDSGTVEYRIEAIHGLTSSFRAESRSAEVSVTGTIFVLAVDEAGTTELDVLSGRLKLQSPLGDRQLSERDSVVVPLGAAPVPMPTLTATWTPTAAKDSADSQSPSPSQTPGP